MAKGALRMSRAVRFAPLVLLLLIILLGECKQSYVSPYKSPPTGYLVVEGLIAGGGVLFKIASNNGRRSSPGTSTLVDAVPAFALV